MVLIPETQIWHCDTLHLPNKELSVFVLFKSDLQLMPPIMPPKRKFCYARLSNDDLSGCQSKVEDNVNQANQKCNNIFASDITSVKRQWTSDAHMSNMSIPNAKPSTDSSDLHNGVTKAELKISLFCAEHNIPFSSVNHFMDLLKDVFPDSKIAQNVILKRLKATTIVEEMGKVAHLEVVDILKHNKFSIIIDETTNTTTSKSYVILARYFNKYTLKIESRLLGLVNIYESDSDSEGSTGKNLYEIIRKCLLDNSIPLDSLIGFAADGASNIMGNDNYLVSRLKVDFPGVTVFKCIRHSAHICASQAAKMLPRQCEDLVRNIYTFFSHNAKRLQHDFKEFQTFCEVKPHKMLHIAQTSWLSLHMAVESVLKHWKPLILCFTKQQLEEHSIVTTNILDSLCDPLVLLCFKFLSFVLPKFTEFSLLFRKADSTVHLLHCKSVKLYSDFLRCYIHGPYVTHNKDLSSIDPADERNYIPLDKIDLGAEFHILSQLPEYADKAILTNVRNHCCQFHIVSCQEIRKRFPLGKDSVEKCSIFSARKVLDVHARLSTPTLSDVVTSFPRIYTDVQLLDDEWRGLDSVTLPTNVTSTTSAELFFTELYKFENYEGETCFRRLSEFVLSILSLPTCNADTERIFSNLNKIQTKLSNEICNTTLSSLITVSEMLKSNDCCVGFQPSMNIISNSQGY